MHWLLVSISRHTIRLNVQPSMSYAHTIGIDISKDTLDTHRLSTGAAAQFANSAAGLRALRRWIGAQMPDLVVYEATGAYHAALERGFAGVLPLVKVNPLQARRFAQARGTRAKTDAVPSHRCKQRLPGNGCACPGRDGIGARSCAGCASRKEST